jgi:hypothetical protein
MATAAELRARIASGEIKERTGGGSVPAGKFAVVLESAEFGIGENNNKRGKIVCRVIGAEDPAIIGRKFNQYIQTKKQDYMNSQIAEYMKLCKEWGISEDRLYDRAEQDVDVVVNIIAEINRLAVKGVLVAQVERKPSGKFSPTGQPTFWTNWEKVGIAEKPYLVDAPKDPSSAITPDLAKVLATTIAESSAPVTPAATTPVANGKKPWEV